MPWLLMPSMCAESAFSHIGGVQNGLQLGSGSSVFIRTNFNNSSVNGADKALMRLYDGHQTQLQVLFPSLVRIQTLQIAHCDACCM